MDLTFEYLQMTNTNEAIKGLFVFSFYFPPHAIEREEKYIRGEINTPVKALSETVYVKGINTYANILAKEDSVFQGWKVLLYTDQITYTALQERGIFVGNPLIEYAIVRWPYYTGRNVEYVVSKNMTAKEVENGSVRGGVMRCMRFRAFFDFPRIPVFVRDADTLYANAISSAFNDRRLDIQVDELYEWEKNYLKGALQHPNKWIFGTSLGYKKFWHENKKKELFAPLGAFAGLQSVMPVVPCFQSEALWKAAVEYILQDSVRIEKNGKITYSNDNEAGSVGKDERILLFVFYPNCDPKDIFFFELDIFHQRTFILKGSRMLHNDYPTYVFERGSNLNLQGLFEKGKGEQFHKNMEANRELIIQKNRSAYTAHSQKITNIMTSLQNMNVELRDRTYQYDPFREMHTTLEIYVESIYNAVKALDTDKSLEALFNTYKSTNEEYKIARKDFLKTVRYPSNTGPLEEDKARLKEAIMRKDAALKAFVEKALTMKSEGEILQRIPSIYTKRVDMILKGKAPPKKRGLFSIMLNETVKGGRQTRKGKKAKRRQTKRH